jgi:hypothetical protein
MNRTGKGVRMCDGFVIRSEFGGVRVSKDTSANGDRVKLVGLKTGAVTYLDPLELESVANLDPEQLQAIVSPEAHT